MKKKTGIWIDTKKAVIIDLSENDKNVRTIQSLIDPKERIPGEKKSFARFGFQFLDFGNKKKKRLAQERTDFVKKVAEEVKDSEAIVIFGPAETKNELGRQMKNDRAFDSINRKIETADSMTENQMVEWVKKYYEIKL